MPQMAPMNWVTLFIMFITIFLVFNTLNYFVFKQQNNISFKKFKKSDPNWKW